MSKSRKNVSFHTCKSKSFKQWKRATNRRFRNRCKQVINTCLDWDRLLLPVINEVDTLWGSPRDGIGAWIDHFDNDECFRNHQNGWYYFKRKDGKEIWGNRYPLGEDGHSLGDSYWGCKCIKNKNSYYNKGFRK